jgi:hypothetical protein
MMDIKDKITDPKENVSYSSGKEETLKKMIHSQSIEKKSKEKKKQ